MRPETGRLDPAGGGNLPLDGPPVAEQRGGTRQKRRRDVIGRFLLGSGLGALVGSGLLAMASVFAPAPQMPGASPAVDETKEPADVKVEPAKADEPAADTTEAPVDEAAVEVLPVVPQPSDLTNPTAPAVEKAPEAPASADPATAPAAPSDLTEPAGDALPKPAETPAASPELAETASPDALADPADASPAPTTPVADTAPADPEAPAGLATASAAEPAPVLGDLPAPPPLTPEEETLLREIAEGGSGSALPEGAVPQPEAALPEPAPTTEAAPPASVDETPKASPEVAPAVETAPTEVADAPLIAPDPTLPSAGTLPADAPVTAEADPLPKIGDTTEAAPAAEDQKSDLPLIAYARKFENPEGKPGFAIVLIDPGTEGIDRAALAALPFPVTFALDPTQPKAAEQAAIYRAAGQEVVILATALPKGAQASDVEVAMVALASALPETVAVMDGPEPAFQSDRPLATLVVPVVGGQGRGLLTWDRGLNAADQVARREKVPAAVVFRDLDAAGESAQVIRRYLDRAAFKAAQEGRVTVVGRAVPETIAALLEWSVEGRAATVALAPLSAVLATD